VAKLTYIKGDLFQHIADSPDKKFMICHVANCHGRMGSGFVIPLCNLYPNVRPEYERWIEEHNSAHFHPGEGAGLGETQFIQASDNVIVANMVAQTLGGKRPLYYNHLASCMDQVAYELDVETEYEIIAPMFGSALAGGDWNFIETLIEDCWLRRGIDVTVFYLETNIPDSPLFHAQNA